ncbi:MAG: hypothetical protein ABEJ26_12635 [Halosimplex sp.]
MSDQEIDVDGLRTELDQIKDAMGIRERSERALERWLHVAALVLVASAASQYVQLRRLSGWYHTAVWVAMFSGYFLAVRFGLFGDRFRYPTAESKPNVLGLVWLVWLANIPIQFVFAGTNAFDGYVAISSHVLGLVVVLLGVSYVVVGNVLKAYYIRWRDRVAFYVGGVWLAALGAAIPNVDVLRTWGYAVFGASYAAYAVGVYLYLRGGSDD